jgi:3-hydroxyisobutyrate dehydrogenase-like beta-hydroxyacid dehydrogenase
MPMKVGFIGLGDMGLAMADNLRRAGHELSVYNRTRRRADALSAVRVAASPREAADGAEVLITMLADDAAVEQVLLGDDGAVNGLARETDAAGGLLRPLQSGRLQRYALFLFASVGVIALAIAIFG